MGGGQSAEPQRGTSAALTLPVPPSPAWIPRLEPSLLSPSSHSCPGPRQLHQPTSPLPNAFWARDYLLRRRRERWQVSGKGGGGGRRRGCQGRTHRARPVCPQGEPSPCPGCTKTTASPPPPFPRACVRGPRTMGIGESGEPAKGRGWRAAFSPSPAHRPGRPTGPPRRTARPERSSARHLTVRDTHPFRSGPRTLR